MFVFDVFLPAMVSRLKGQQSWGQINAYFLESEKFEVSFEFFEGCVEVCFALGCWEGDRGDGSGLVQWINGKLDNNAASIIGHVDVSIDCELEG